MEPEHKWPEGWDAATPSVRENIEAQLLRELGAGHPLATHSPTYIGRNGSSDDFVFSVTHWKAPYFVVHLTWSANASWVPGCVPLEQISDLEAFPKN